MAVFRGRFLFSQEDIAVKEEPAVSSCFYIERQHSAALSQKGKIMKKRMDSGLKPGRSAAGTPEAVEMDT